MKERWKDVIDFEGMYQVSNLGRVRSLDRVVSHKRTGTARLKGRILLLTPCIKHGRVESLRVNLSQAGVTTVRTVHQLVLEVFVGPCPDGHEGCHYDGDPTNNIVSNLRWDTRGNNQLDCRRHGTFAGKRVRRSDGVEFVNMHVAAEETGCGSSNICAVCKGRQKTTGGYGWEYAENNFDSRSECGMIE